MPSAKKHQRLINSAALPSEHKKLELYIAAQEMLEAAGYITIGIDHFAKVDDPLTIAMQNRTLKRNFQGYVTDAADALIGFGSSAISQLPQGYVQNHVVAANYRNAIAEGKLPVARGWKFGSEDILRKNIVDGLMCFMSADVDENHFKPEIEELQKPEYREIVSYTNGRITITTKYRMAARVVAAVFDQYRAVAAGRYSKVA